MSEKTVRIELCLNTEPETDDGEVEKCTRQLREELTGLDVESVGLVRSGKAPDNAKAIDPISIGRIIVECAESIGIFTSLPGYPGNLIAEIL